MNSVGSNYSFLFNFKESLCQFSSFKPARNWLIFKTRRLWVLKNIRHFELLKRLCILRSDFPLKSKSLGFSSELLESFARPTRDLGLISGHVWRTQYNMYCAPAGLGIPGRSQTLKITGVSYSSYWDMIPWECWFCWGFFMFMRHEQNRYNFPLKENEFLQWISAGCSWIMSIAPIDYKLPWLNTVFNCV